MKYNEKKVWWSRGVPKEDFWHILEDHSCDGETPEESKSCSGGSQTPYAAVFILFSIPCKNFYKKEEILAILWFFVH